MECERCGKMSNRENPFALWSYCEFCSKNLCDDCMKIGKCRESKDGKHHDIDDENAERIRRKA